MKFTHLHLHSTYSIQDGIGTPKQIIKKIKSMGHDSVAITDHGSMSNIAEFYSEAKKENVKSIFGCEFYFIHNVKKNDQKREELLQNKNKYNKEDYKKRLSKLRKNYHLILLAKNKTGLKNLFSLNYFANRDGFYFKPRIDLNLLKKYSEGLIVTSACIGGIFARPILEKKKDLLKKHIKFFKKLFKNDLYIEMQINELKDQKKVNKILNKISEKYKIKKILTGDSHYIEKGWEKQQQILLLLNNKKTFKDLKEGNAWSFDTKNLYIKTAKEYIEFAEEQKSIFSKNEILQMLKNTNEIDNKIESIKLNSDLKLLKFNDKENDIKSLYEICRKNLIKKRLNKKKIYTDRLKKEINTINKMKMSNYFLVVENIVRYAKDKMFVGVGRGSGAGSLVNYLLEITQIDPIKYNLSFERFMNLARKNVADIDIDFEDPDYIKDFMKEKYGKDNVAMVSNYSTFLIKGLLKDLNRVYDLLSFQDFNKLSKDIFGAYKQDDEEKILHSITLEKIKKKSKMFVEFLNKYPFLEDDINILTGQIRHVSKHASGVVMCKDLYKKIPLQKVKDEIQTGYTEGLHKQELGKLGFIKYDILGLKTLKVLHKTLDIEKKDYEEIHPDNIKLEDENIYKSFFHTGLLKGIFQFNTSGLIGYIKKLKPDVFNDLVMANALFRPGPKDSNMHLEFVERKRNKSLIKYFDKRMIDILKETYGIITYQEQIMSIANKIAGYTLAETDVFRKDILKKEISGDKEYNQDVKKVKIKFIKGCMNTSNFSKEKSVKLWKLLKTFARYGFNKSHSLSYSMIAYQCAYLKYHYTAAFYTALLIYAKQEEYFEIVNEIFLTSNYLNKKIDIKLIDINKSKETFSLDKDIIFFGFINVKNVGIKATNELIKYQPYRSFFHFLFSKIKWNAVNKRIIEILIKVGAFDCFDKNRKRVLKKYKLFSHLKNKLSKEKFTRNKKKIIKKIKNKTDENIIDFSIDEKFQFESEFVGTTFGAIVLFARYKIKIDELKKRKVLKNISKHNTGFFCLYFFKINIRPDKNQDDMAFVDCIDETGNQISLIIFASYYKHIEKKIKNKTYIVTAYKSEDNKLIMGKKNQNRYEKLNYDSFLIDISKLGKC